MRVSVASLIDSKPIESFAQPAFASSLNTVALIAFARAYASQRIGLGSSNRVSSRSRDFGAVNVESIARMYSAPLRVWYSRQSAAIFWADLYRHFGDAAGNEQNLQLNGHPRIDS